jgi:ribonuclease HI
VSQFITKLDHESLLEALFVARLVWHRRNGFVHGGGMVCSPAHRIAIQRWMKPSPGWVNWDATVSSTEKTMGVGVVVRDAEGSFMVGLTASLPYVRDPLIAEMVAARRAVELGKEMGCQRIILEGDSLIIVTALNKDHPCSSSYGQVIDDIRVHLSSFHNHFVSHVSRQANNAAHVLAQFALTLSCDRVWKEECPPLSYTLYWLKSFL